MQYRWQMALLLVVIIGTLMVGCPKIQQIPPPETGRAVDWVQAGSGLYILHQEPLFLGVGHAAGSRNPTLLRAAADNQAQEEMARVLHTYFDRLLNAAGWQGEPDEREQILYGLRQDALQRARITDHRFNESSESLFALCSLALAEVEVTLRYSSYIGTILKKEMLGRAEDVHAQGAAAP